MRDSFADEPRRLLGWLSDHIRSLPRVQKTSHSKSSRNGTPATLTTTYHGSSSLPFRSPLSKITAATTPTSPSFKFFPLLPFELRILIWEFALFTSPRVIHFNEVISIPSPISDLRSNHLLISTPIPSSLQICLETRDLALKHYIFSEGNIRLYLDPEIDSLYFKNLPSITTLEIFACCSAIEDLRRLKKLVVNEAFLSNLGRRSVWNGLGENCIEGPAFKLLSGLEELILVVRPENPHKGKSRGLSTLGPIFYERHCTTCQKMNWWVGMDGWIFPTYSQFVAAERNGVENIFAEKAYIGILQLQSRMRSQWLEGFVNSRMKNVCRVDFDRRQGNIRACSVAGLHRFVDLLNE